MVERSRFRRFAARLLPAEDLSRPGPLRTIFGLKTAPKYQRISKTERLGREDF
jgi:hypothetical protein